MKSLTEDGITRSALSRIADCPNPRLKEVVRALTRHLHEFAREVKLTPEEWFTGIQFLTAAGHITDDKRQEFILLSDTLGLSAMVDLIANREAEPGATESSLLGPFFRENAPVFPMDADISNGAAGEKMVVQSRLLNAEGNPVAGAMIDTWQASSEGIYDLQQANSDKMNFRSRFRSDENGRFRFRSVKPSSYPVPADGPVGKMLRELARHPYRPAHIHFMIAAPGYKTLTTALYIAGDRYLNSDVVFGSKKSLVVNYRHSATNGASADSIEFDFVLTSTEKRKRPKKNR
ncbi:MAG: intradiol ring-cleavage dioxygenase [Candidatus Binataceae bacterium]